MVFKKKSGSKKYGNEYLYNNITRLHNGFFDKLNTNKKTYIYDFNDFRKFFSRYLKREILIDKKMTTYHLLNKGQTFASLCLHDYQAYLSEQTKCSTATINRRVSVMNSLLKEANTHGLIAWLIQVRSLKIRRVKKQRGPTFEQVKGLWQKLKQLKGFEGKRDRALFCTLYHMGLRRFEVTGIDLKNINLNKNTLEIKSKGYRDPEVIEITLETAKYFKEYYDLIDKRKKKYFYLDPLLKRPLNNENIRIITKKWSEMFEHTISFNPHAFRYSAITRVLDKVAKRKLSLTEALKFSRHKNISTLLIYEESKLNAQKIFQQDLASELE